MKERTRDQGGPGTLTDDLVIPEIDASTLAGEPLADLAAHRVRADRARAAGHVDDRARRDRAGLGRAADLVLAARPPGPGAPGGVQHRHGPEPGPAGRRRG